jgi:hypothetical protein
VNSVKASKFIGRFFIAICGKLVLCLPQPIYRYKNGTRLILEYFAFTDTSSARNIYLGTDATFANPMTVRNLVYDTTVPIITYIALDLTKQTLSLTFSEVADVGR